MEKLEEWKTIDLEKCIKNDLDAAMAFLGLIRTKPHIFQAIVQIIEDDRKQMVEAEKLMKDGRGKK